ncbi:unnamed protein product, partial [Iphiclides podalirius]
MGLERRSAAGTEGDATDNAHAPSIHYLVILTSRVRTTPRRLQTNGDAPPLLFGRGGGRCVDHAPRIPVSKPIPANFTPVASRPPSTADQCRALPRDRRTRNGPK